MSNKTPWKDTENSALIALYFEMLDYAIPGKQYSKAGLIRIAMAPPLVGHPPPAQDAPFASKLSERTRGSIEFKLMNAAACHADLDANATTMHGFGYRAMPNYQASLKLAMADKLAERTRRDQVSYLVANEPAA